MNLTPKAQETLESMVADCDGDLFAVVERNYAVGICCECGETREEVEPDATGYECESCGLHKVVGLETAFLIL